MIGADGFEPSTSTSRTLRASRAALRPDKIVVDNTLAFSLPPIKLCVNSHHNFSKARFRRHAFVFDDILRLPAEDKTVIHVITLI